VKYVYINEHRVNWEDSKILCFENDYFKHRFLETFFIQTTNNTENDKENCYFSQIYQQFNID